jgi:hypothetical protein
VKITSPFANPVLHTARIGMTFFAGAVLAAAREILAIRSVLMGPAHEPMPVDRGHNDLAHSVVVIFGRGADRPTRNKFSVQAIDGPDTASREPQLLDRQRLTLHRH